MPSKTGRQHRFMLAVAHDAEFAKKAGVPQTVGEDFAKTDAGKTVAAPKTRREKLYGKS